MKTMFKFLMTIALVSVVSSASAQKSAQQGVSIGMDLQPILQIDMSSPEMINFVFDEKGKFQKGITQN